MEVPVSFFNTTLFEAVQMGKIFPDGKTFVDCIPKKGIADILLAYEKEKGAQRFDLKLFVLQHFELPATPDTNFVVNSDATIADHIESLWPALTRSPDIQTGTLIPLPHPYIVPGGRFGEIYYWDSYFTMLGLKESGRSEMIGYMIQNFSHLINIIGYIPNGNRNYYLGRSQPPFFVMMVKLLAEIKGEQVLQQYLPQLEKEYQFWMQGSADLINAYDATNRVVKMPDGSILNRYWDIHDTPRPESYREDKALAEQAAVEPRNLFRNLRAAAESGWDFSSRWLKDGRTLHSIHTTSIIPVDLNCLLFELEQTLAHTYKIAGNEERTKQYQSAATRRQTAIRTYCWNDDKGFYVDVDWEAGMQKEQLTLAGVASLFFSIAAEQEAERMSNVINEYFLCAGGVVTTLQNTGQQWDEPNGWAPLQWMTIRGLENYGFSELAKEIATRWTRLNNEVYRRTGKLMEKYDVIDLHLEAGGGEYPGQDGFGWTNGVFAALAKKYAILPVLG